MDCTWIVHAVFSNTCAKRGVELHMLRVNGNGEPAHPLYLPASLEPLPFK